MTEVAQVAAIAGHDMEDVVNEDEHDMSGTENKDDEDVTVQDPEDSAEKMSHEVKEESCPTNDTTSDETDKAQVNGVEHKTNGTMDEDHIQSEAVNGVTEKKEEDTQLEDKNEDLNISDVALKKEVRQKMEKTLASYLNLCRRCDFPLLIFLSIKPQKLLRSRKQVMRSYVPKQQKEKGEVTNKYAAMQKAREERSRQRNNEEQQKRKEQYIKEREWSRRKQQVKDR